MAKHLNKGRKTIEVSLQNRADNISRFLNNNGDDLEPMAKKLADLKIFCILSGQIPVPLSYDEGDQSPMKSQERDAKILRNHWASGLDNFPFLTCKFHYLSEWMKVIWSGDYNSFLKMIENKSEMEIKNLVSRRETLCNISAIFFVINGARTLFSDHPQFARDQMLARKNLNVKNEHMKVLVKLLTLGCDVNVRDFAGYTPLHHCCTMFGNEVTLKMAERLIRAGADVNAKNRFGYSPLMEISMADGRYDIFSFLLDHGANPYLECNEGYSTLTIVRWNPKMMELIGKSYRNKVRQIKEKEDADDKCVTCGKSDKNNKKCSGCYHVWYCSAQCQRDDRPNHKMICKEIEAEYVWFNYEDSKTYVGLNTEGKVSMRVSGNRAKKSHFAVKIQTPSPDCDRIHKDSLVLYNKDKSFFATIMKKNNKEHFQVLFDKIKADGYYGVKGYFHVILLEGSSNQVKINSKRILPLQVW